MLTAFVTKHINKQMSTVVIIMFLNLFSLIMKGPAKSIAQDENEGVGVFPDAR